MNFQKFYHMACQNRCIVEQFFSRVSFQMPSQIIRVNRFKVAMVAFWQFFSRMSFQMSSQIACQNTCIVALVAFARLFSGVWNFRCGQTACLNKCIVALVSLVWFVSVVRFQMCPQISCLSRCKVVLVALEWFFSRVGFQKCSEIACTNRFIVTLVAFKHFFSEGVFNCPLETPASTDAKSHWLHFFIFLLNEFSIVSSESTYAHSWIIKLIASFLHSKQSDLSDGVWPSHHLTDVEQPSKPIKYEGIPKNHQQTIEHDGYPQPFHSKVIHQKRCQSDNICPA